MATPTGDTPAPAERVSVRFPYRLVVPYSTHHPVERPFGSTVPPRFAAPGPMSPAAPVRTSGAPRVVNVIPAPRLVPSSLVATTRYWYVTPVESPVSW